ncbi:MAG: undecaprenyl-diphosphatase [Methanobacterium sp.]|uniref:undecaprenyl-diphosphatase n=1 Tax=Methanobacterium sp. TaxID=2164 RepID=UPI003C71DB27
MIEQINIALFHLINQYAGINPIFDSIVIFAAEYMPIIVILFMLYLWIRKGDRTHDILLYSIYAGITGLIINYLIGLVYFHPRPLMLHLGTQLFAYPTDSSFPSDHTTLMVSIALMLIYFRETRIYGVIILILGLIGGFARVFSGIHFPFDIFGSVIVAIISSALIFYFKENFNPLNNLIKQIYSKITALGR